MTAFPSAELSSDEAIAALAPDAVKSLMRRVCDYQLSIQSQDRATSKVDINYEWVRGAFYTGMLPMYDSTGDSKYLAAAKAYAESRNWQLDISDIRNADWQCIGQLYVELYLRDKDPRYIDAIKHNIDAQMADPKPGREEWWWCDALYMAPPVLARLHAATGDRRYLEFLNSMFWDSHAFLYNEAEHLFFRDKKYFAARTKNGREVYWSRGNGWVLAGIARVLDHLPHDDPGREKFQKLFSEMSDRIAGLQGSDGLWRTSLLDPDEFPLGETSGSGFFVYAMAWGINNGLLEDSQYAPVVKKGWLGLAKAVDDDGKLGYVQTVAAEPGPVEPGDTREYAAGALLLAGSEILRMNRPQQ